MGAAPAPTQAPAHAQAMHVRRPCMFARHAHAHAMPQGDILDVINAWPDAERARAYAAIAQIEEQALADMRVRVRTRTHARGVRLPHGAREACPAAGCEQGGRPATAAAWWRTWGGRVREGRPRMRDSAEGGYQRAWPDAGRSMPPAFAPQSNRCPPLTPRPPPS